MFHYTLNHFALSSDPSTDKLLGPAQIREEIELDHGGDAYFGPLRSINMMSRDTFSPTFRARSLQPVSP
jgi:hypothetical protein